MLVPTIFFLHFVAIFGTFIVLIQLAENKWDKPMFQKTTRSGKVIEEGEKVEEKVNLKNIVKNYMRKAIASIQYFFLRTIDTQVGQVN